MNSEVVVIGGGIAGLAAALRLAERGYQVTILDQDDHLGGKLGAYQDRGNGEFYEHSYHMYLNWYVNFWAIVDQLGLGDEFEPRHHIHFLREGEFPHTTSITDVGAPDTVLRNVMSGVIPPADMFIYAYSLVDLLTQRYQRDSFLDRISVNGFMSSRPYATDSAAIQHSRTLSKAFASYSYRTSAASYRRFIEFGARQPSPMMWVLRGNVHEHLIKVLEAKLIQLGCRIRKLTRVERLVLDTNGCVKSLTFSTLDRSPTQFPNAVRRTGEGSLPVSGNIVCAIPPGALSKLVDDSVHVAAPELGRVSTLNSEPMASLDLHFNRKLQRIPKDHVVLMGSPHELTFIDNAQLWPDYKHTFLSIVASETNSFSSLSEDSATQIVIKELRRYVPFELEDIDWSRSRIRYNLENQLFLNEVGSWVSRPPATCAIVNLFIAGDFCRTFVDVVTIEGAVVSGYNAAQAIVDRTGVGTRLQILRPPGVSRAQMQLLKVALAPQAYWAKTWSMFGRAGAAAQQQRQST